MKLLVVGLISLGLVVCAHAHGRLTEPAGRATCWRYGYDDCAINYDDDGMNCGGFGTQWNKNGGKCGVCGDDWAGNRPHEAGPNTVYAKKVITGSYDQGGVIDIKFEITTNHGGWHEFRICPNDNFDKNVSQSCLDQHLLEASEDGSTRWTIDISEGNKEFSRSYRLPPGVVCKTQCLLQWKWHCANSWDCDDPNDHTSCCLGCGPQEQFYGCSDITID